MITLSRTVLLGAEFLNEETVRFHGSLEDHIYGMEIRMDVRIPEGVVESIQGWMKRYTNPVCPQALEVLQKAVGMSLRGEGWISKINKVIGRQGCTHFAEIIIECGRCLDPARLAHAAVQALEADPGADQNQVARAWIESHPEARGRCMARP